MIATICSPYGDGSWMCQTTKDGAMVVATSRRQDLKIGDIVVIDTFFVIDDSKAPADEL